MKSRDSLASRLSSFDIGQIVCRIAVSSTKAVLYFGNNPDYSRLIYCFTFPILTQYHFHSDLESRGRRRPFRTLDLAGLSLRTPPPPPPPFPAAALFDNAMPFKSQRDIRASRFQGRHIPRRSVVLAPAYHAGQQSVASNLSGAKPQRYTRMRRGTDRAVDVCTGRQAEGERDTLGHTRGSLSADKVYDSERLRGCCWLFLFEICDTSPRQR